MSNKTSVCVNEVKMTLNGFDTYEIDHEPLGSGGFGVIYRGVRKSDGKEFALKFFGYTDRVPNITDINGEIVLMLTLAGVEGIFKTGIFSSMETIVIGTVGVIQIESIFYDSPMGLLPNKQKALQNSYPVIVMESLTGGDLLHRIDARARQNKPISERFLAQTFKSMMHALDSLHRRFYIHSECEIIYSQYQCNTTIAVACRYAISCKSGDIKLANVLLVSEADDSEVKLIDFGSLIQLDRATMTVITNDPFGTPRFMAPESLGRFNREYSTASDIWQSGCVLF
jgi:serine/threonine protein kinase